MRFGVLASRRDGFVDGGPAVDGGVGTLGRGLRRPLAPDVVDGLARSTASIRDVTARVAAVPAANRLRRFADLTKAIEAARPGAHVLGSAPPLRTSAA